jgi:hypothetical protein
MDFLVCKKACSGTRKIPQKDILLTDIKDIKKAISMARFIASESRKGLMVALFTQDAKPVYGWKVMGKGELKYMEMDVIKDNFYNVIPADIILAKREDVILTTRR